MATYAVLGSTGNTGKCLVELALQQPNAKVHAYCRNKTKLTNQLPIIIDNKRVEVFEGSIYDVDLFVDCLRGCRAVFLTITTNDNVPGCHMSQDSVRTIIAALVKLKKQQGPSGTIPKILLLSSATIDEHLNRDMPGWFKPIMKAAASNVYDDLKVAEQMLRAEDDWLTTIYIKPGGLSLDVQRGHKLSLDKQESFISYYDLAAAMIEAADDVEGRYDMKNVGVVNANGGARFPPGTPMCIAVGLLRHFFPWLHNYLPSTGPA
uniref:Oxidoreductase GME11367 n=1 Tax=Pestalotiopsis microspora TaxID=85828 RepID=GME67_PESMI|nr:RecName: Full=Oxidoreductase GME11367; AltName: Full=Dibenzodioxocinones biosynthesis cluster protein GME11367 [Pestalotiopsis microspora]QED41498.1 putative NAD-dependent dehydratase [Pestalotiopsis microspora]